VYPSVSPVANFNGRLVRRWTVCYRDKIIESKGAPVTNVLIHVWYGVEDHYSRMVVSPVTRIRSEKHYYTFSDTNGAFSISGMLRPHIVIRSIGKGRWTTIRNPTIQLLANSSNMMIIDSNRPAAGFGLTYGQSPGSLDEFLEKHATPLFSDDEAKLERYLREVEEIKAIGAGDSPILMPIPLRRERQRSRESIQAIEATLKSKGRTECPEEHLVPKRRWQLLKRPHKGYYGSG